MKYFRKAVGVILLLSAVMFPVGLTTNDWSYAFWATVIYTPIIGIIVAVIVLGVYLIS